MTDEQADIYNRLYWWLTTGHYPIKAEHLEADLLINKPKPSTR